MRKKEKEKKDDVVQGRLYVLSFTGGCIMDSGGASPLAGGSPGRAGAVPITVAASATSGCTSCSTIGCDTSGGVFCGCRAAGRGSLRCSCRRNCSCRATIMRWLYNSHSMVAACSNDSG